MQLCEHLADRPCRVQADIQRHLIVAAAAGVQALARVADAGGQRLLHKGVDVLGVGVDLQLAGCQIVGRMAARPLRMSSQSCSEMMPCFASMAAWRQLPAHILRDHPLVKADGGVEVVDRCESTLPSANRPSSIEFSSP